MQCPGTSSGRRSADESTSGTSGPLRPRSLSARHRRPRGAHPEGTAVTLHIHTLAGDDPARYLSYDAAAISDVTDRFDRYLDAGNFRPEWMWIAEHNGDV